MRPSQSKKLSVMLESKIKAEIPNIQRTISSGITDLENELESLGGPGFEVRRR